MSKRAFPVLDAGGVRLRLLEESDLELTRAWRNQDHIRKWFLNSEPITAEQHRAWYGKYRERDDDFVFMIEEGAQRRRVGQVSLYRIEWDAGRAEFGRLMIGERDAAGKGLAKAATGLLVGHALDALGLEEIHLEVLTDNAAAVAIYGACGFETAERRGDVLVMRKFTSKRGRAG
jgi:RimJ/RimL family protein N-acetyltransferase